MIMNYYIITETNWTKLRDEKLLQTKTEKAETGKTKINK